MIDKKRIGKCADLIAAWANARNLIDGAKPKDQMLKLTSEFGEMVSGLLDDDYAEVIDGIGDTLVVAIVICNQLYKAEQPGHGQNNCVFFNAMDVAMSESMANDVGVLTPQQHVLRAMAAIGRMSDDLLKGFTGGISVSLARLIYNLNMVCKLRYIRLDDCLESAYNAIKDRKGVMFNGAFIKESDPAYAGALEALASSSKTKGA